MRQFQWMLLTIIIPKKNPDKDFSTHTLSCKEHFQKWNKGETQTLKNGKFKKGRGTSKAQGRAQKATAEQIKLLEALVNDDSPVPEELAAVEPAEQPAQQEDEMSLEQRKESIKNLITTLKAPGYESMLANATAASGSRQ